MTSAASAGIAGSGSDPSTASITRIVFQLPCMKRAKKLVAVRKALEAQ